MTARAQVLATCDYEGGTLQHALALARALSELGFRTQLTSLRPRILRRARDFLAAWGIELVDGDRTPTAVDVNLVVDLQEPPCREAARSLAGRGGRLILVPTGYAVEHPLPEMQGAADAVWYVSWDQAIDSRSHWDMARQVEVVRCAVDTARFRPSDKEPGTDRWVLCRHSRDSEEKYSNDIFYVLNEIGSRHDVRLRMLGARETMRAAAADRRVDCHAESSLDVAAFLQEGHLWFFSHAAYWRESACIAMLEAMSCGLPVVVTGAGGMREYLRHGETGFLCRDRDEFIGFIKLLLDRPELYRRMRGAARRFVEDHHSPGVLRQRLSELLGSGA